MHPKAEWNSVIYQGNAHLLPPERWGHKLLKVHDYLLLFGGYGGLPEGQGKYLKDLWKFDLINNRWDELITTGDVPSERSNYTIHFNANREQVILFGGGAENKARYNTIYILNMETLVWRQIVPELGEQAPWERTYHVSELFHNYLVVFGGEGISNLDLNDTWAFDLNMERWIKLQPQGSNPTRRRFASSALVGSDLYLLGGCRDNYEFLGDMHCLSLLPLLSGKLEDLKWQEKISSHKLLRRWGHSTQVYNNKLYIFSGRVSADRDDNCMIEYDCLKKELKELQSTGKAPLPRRRHGTAIVGSCYLVFGGFNAKYFNDFHSLKIFQSIDEQKLTDLMSINSKVNFEHLIMRERRRMPKKQSLKVICGDVEEELSTSTIKLSINPYFRSLLKEEGTLKLPNLFTMETFKIVHFSLLEGKLCLWKDIALEECFEIAQCFSYFCCESYLELLQIYLISRVKPSNSIQMLHLSTQLSLETLREVSITTLLRSGKNRIDLLTWSIPGCQQQQCYHLIECIKGVEKKLKFELIQNRLRQVEKSPILKTVDALRSIFTTQPQKIQEGQKKLTQKPEKTCLQFLMKCFNGLFSFYGVRQESS